MKKLILASAIASAFAGQVAYAADAAPAPAATPEHVVTYNMGVTTDYVFRGISQSRNGPAVSGGVDYSHSPTGLYLGAWTSTIKWVNDSDTKSVTARSNTPMEVDVYGGIKGDIGGGLSYDAGGIYYYYPGHKLGSAPDANTFEVYGKLAYGPVYFKVNYALTDAFFFADKAGSYYLDLGGDFPLTEGLVANVHYGYFSFKNTATVTASTADYQDWKVGLTKDLGNGLSGAVAATGTNADKTAWNFGPGTGYLGGNKVIASLTKTF